jgi:hypothetical protein
MHQWRFAAADPAAGLPALLLLCASKQPPWLYV